jgi:hypothetical protein
MPKGIPMDEIFRNNPQIQEELKRNSELAKELAKLGVTRRGYRLVPPNNGTRIRIGNEGTEDPRTRHLRRF